LWCLLHRVTLTNVRAHWLGRGESTSASWSVQTHCPGRGGIAPVGRSPAPPGLDVVLQPDGVAYCDDEVVLRGQACRQGVAPDRAHGVMVRVARRSTSQPWSLASDRTAAPQ
ncbi:MAG: hypothetical protein ACRDTD_16430, partial [Pseudonocardiaceae bacterium]